jgi:hypothetical protein
MQTPWGNSDFSERKALGIWWYSTPSHGGYHVIGAALDKIPMEWRRASFNGQGLRGWFEEDCDWCMVALTFPELFTAAVVKQAQGTFDYWIAKKLSA